MLIAVRPSSEVFLILYTSLWSVGGGSAPPHTSNSTAPSKPAPFYFTRNGFEFSPEAVVTVRRTKPFFPPLGTVVVMLSFFC
jgi:hypothetical protein